MLTNTKTTMIQLRDYQEEISRQACNILGQYAIVYLAMEVRTGKTLTALQAATLYGAKKVLFMTKKKAVDSKTILNDYNALQPDFQITITNNESLHKVMEDDFDLIISDEHHRNSSYPKPNKTTKLIRERFRHLPMIFLSGTPAIESGSQWYHSFWVSDASPFSKYRNFYAWAKDYVKPKIKHLGAIKIPDYSEAYDDLIMTEIKHLIIKYTQKEAGFKAEISEQVIYYDIPKNVSQLVDTLLRDEIIIGKTDNVVADTAVAMLNKIHQIENGTVITEGGNSFVVDKYKAEYMKMYFTGRKIAVFYYFQKELDLLEQVFGKEITTDIDRFNTENINFAIQQISGSEAISLKAAQALVYYNYGYSGKNYTQGRDRMTTKEREENEVYFLIGKKSLNERIYKTIQKKKRYNEKLFIKDYGRRTKITK